MVCFAVVEVTPVPVPTWQLTVHDRVFQDSEFGQFELIQQLAKEISALDELFNFEVVMAMLSFRGSTSNAFFEALTSGQRNNAKYLISILTD